uniref:Uncharacterized protein n=1 Tax=Steinernema glaseri TaxID=37863 RepID=A0A1I8ABX9_9BILA
MRDVFCLLLLSLLHFADPQYQNYNPQSYANQYYNYYGYNRGYQAGYNNGWRSTYYSLPTAARGPVYFHRPFQGTVIYSPLGGHILIG